jgi:hypothetical protein
MKVWGRVALSFACTVFGSGLAALVKQEKCRSFDCAQDDNFSFVSGEGQVRVFGG